MSLNKHDLGCSSVYSFGTISKPDHFFYGIKIIYIIKIHNFFR